MQASPSARVGALLLASGPVFTLALQATGEALQPLKYAAWLATSFGVLSFCEAMGAARPLNRGGLILFAAAFCAATAILVAGDPLTIARARLLYAFAMLGAVTLWSIALIHRPSVARAAGIGGIVLGAGGLAALIGAHLAVGSGALFGFGALFQALASPTETASAATTVIDAMVAAWAVVAATLMWLDRLKD